jgi:hypothetical protein
MKDFYDIYVILKNCKINKGTLKNAVKLTFENRNTKLSKDCAVFTPLFYDNKTKQQQWQTFLSKNNLISPAKDFKEIVLYIKKALM